MQILVNKMQGCKQKIEYLTQKKSNSLHFWNVDLGIWLKGLLTVPHWLYKYTVVYVAVSMELYVVFLSYFV